MTRRLAVAFAVAVAFAAIVPAVSPAAYRGSTIDQNIGSHHDLGGGSADRYPTGNYALDHHVDKSVLDPNSVGDDWKQSLAEFMALVAFWLLRTVLSLFSWAFSTDFLTGPHGALSAVSQAERQVHQNLISQGWMEAAVAGMVAVMLFRLFRRRTHEAFVGVFISFLCAAVLGAFLLDPAGTLDGAVRFDNGASASLLGEFDSGGTDVAQARRNIADTLNTAFALREFAVLETGGLKHCVDMAHRDAQGFPTPVDADTPGATCRDHLQRDRNGYGGYVAMFLKYPPNSYARDLAYESLRDGEPATPTDPGCSADQVARGLCTEHKGASFQELFPGQKLDKADAPAVDIQQREATADRLLWSLSFLIGAVGATLLFGSIVFNVLAAAVAVLLLLVVGPAVMLAGVAGAHGLVKTWATTLAACLFVKIVYGLLLGGLTAIVTVLMAGGDAVGVSMKNGYLLMAGCCWLAFLNRKKAVRWAVSATGGQADTGGTRMLGLYSAYRAGRIIRRSGPRGLSQRFSRVAGRLHGGGGDDAPSARRSEASAADAPTQLPGAERQPSSNGRAPAPDAPLSESFQQNGHTNGHVPNPSTEDNMQPLPKHAQDKLARDFPGPDGEPGQPLPDYAQQRLRERFNSQASRERDNDASPRDLLERVATESWGGFHDDGTPKASPNAWKDSDRYDPLG